MVHLVERLKAVETSPILKNGPEYHGRLLERSAESAMRIPVAQFENQTCDLQRIARQLEDQSVACLNGAARTVTSPAGGGAAFVVGILSMLSLPRVVPNSLAPRVAGLVMAATPWQAGMDLLTWASPESVGRVASADRLVEANKEDLTACRDAAKRTGKEQKCAITVPAPTQ